MAQLILAFSDLYTYISNFLGLTATGTAPTGTDLTTCKNICYRGYRRFLYPVNIYTGSLHNWSFLNQIYSINTAGDKWKYQLPEDFSDILTNPQHGEADVYPDLIKLDAQQINQMRVCSDNSGYPQYYAIVPLPYGEEIGTYYELWMYPTPDGVYDLNFFYRIDPIKITEAADLLVGGVKATEAILENCLAVAEQQEDDIIGIHSRLADESTQKLIIADVATDPDIIGNLYWGAREREFVRGQNIRIDPETQVYPS